jgi:hypothetical protein
VTGTWKVPIAPAYPSPPANGVPFLLRIPDGPGAPAPGRYQLTVARPGLPGWQAAGVPFNVAAWVNPAGGPLLTAVGGIYALEVRNVPATGAALRLGTVPLHRVAAGTMPAPGEWQGSGTAITFAAPATLAPGQYQVGLRVADIESDPAKWAVV